MSVRGRDLPTHTRGNSRGSDYVVESTTADTTAMVNAPKFDGYLLYRSSNYLSSWRTLWIVLEGHYLRGFRSKDSAVPSWSKHMVDCEIKAHDKKYSFKIKVSGKRPYIQLRARDVGEFQCWLAVLQRSKAWNDTTKHDLPIPLERSESGDSLDIETALSGSSSGTAAQSGAGDMFVELEMPVLTEDMTAEDISDLRKRTKRTMVAQLVQLQAAYARLDKRTKSDDVNAFVRSTKDAIGSLSSYTFLLESERDHWITRWEQEHKEFMDLDHSIGVLAREHLRLETSIQRATAAADASSSSFLLGDDDDDIDADAANDDDSDDDDANQFYDALERRRSVQDESDESDEEVFEDIVPRQAGKSPLSRVTSSSPASSSPTSSSRSKASRLSLETSRAALGGSAASNKRSSSLRRSAAAGAAGRSVGTPDGGALERTRSLVSLSTPVSSTLPFVRRTALPVDKSKQKASVWAILKHSIGKDLSRIGFPIIFNEPLSALQRMCEDLEYADLLDYASGRQTSHERLAYLAIFSATNYSTVIGRTAKPFNPILGETYECIRPERGHGWRYIGEQVSHHPPVSAMYATSLQNTWRWQEEMQVTNGFRGKDLEVYPVGYSHVWFPSSGDHYSWKKVTTCVRNVIFGTMWMDNFGTSRITNHTTGDYVDLIFKPYSYIGGDLGVVEGTVKDKDGKAHWIIGGRWNEALTLQPADRSQPPKTIWRRLPLPDRAEAQFNMTSFALSLNEIEPGTEKILPPTDCRRRTDQRLYEDGKLDEAQAEKERLEDAQRSARRIREARGEAYKPLFFTHSVDPDLKVGGWHYSGNYWERREKRDWKGMPDIYGVQK